MNHSTRFRRVFAALLTLCLLLATPALAAQQTSAPAARELEIRTYRNIPYHARFLTTGGSGEDVSFEIVQEPRHGTVAIDGAEFTYTPDKDRCGSDRFTYLCRDAQGNASAEAEVTVTVSRVKSGVTYADTDGSGAEAAGVQAGDRVLAVDDTAVSDSSALKNYLKDKAIGDSVNLQVERNGKVQTLTVTLGSNQ